MRLASHAVYREFVTSFGLSFYPLGGRPEVSYSSGCSSGMLTLSETWMTRQQAPGEAQPPLHAHTQQELDGSSASAW